MGSVVVITTCCRYVGFLKAFMDTDHGLCCGHHTLLSVCWLSEGFRGHRSWALLFHNTSCRYVGFLRAFMGTDDTKDMEMTCPSDLQRARV